MSKFERLADAVQVFDDYHGESYTIVSFYRVPRETPDDEVKAWVAERFPARHCQHSYDCCANYYPSQGRFYRAPYSNLLIVHQGFACNI